MSGKAKAPAVVEAEPAGQAEPTLTDVMDGGAVPFEVDGTTFFIRQPTTDEYDDALSMQRLVAKRMLALPEVAELKATPCSDGERTQYERLIAQAEARFNEAERGSRAKQAAADEVGALRRALDGRTLADEVANERGVLARDRWLTLRLLCHGDTDAEGRAVCGAAYFDPHSPGVKAAFDGLSMRVKEAARPAIWLVLAMVQNAPFSSGRPPKPA